MEIMAIHDYLIYKLWWCVPTGRQCNAAGAGCVSTNHVHAEPQWTSPGPSLHSQTDTRPAGQRPAQREKRLVLPRQEVPVLVSELWNFAVHSASKDWTLFWSLKTNVIVIISKRELLRSIVQVPGATCVTHGLVLIVCSESLSLWETKAVLCCLPSTGRPPPEQPLTPVNAPAHRAGPRSSLAQRERREILCLDLTSIFFFFFYPRKSNHSFSVHALQFKTKMFSHGLYLALWAIYTVYSQNVLLKVWH